MQKQNNLMKIYSFVTAFLAKCAKLPNEFPYLVPLKLGKTQENGHFLNKIRLDVTGETRYYRNGNKL